MFRGTKEQADYNLQLQHVLSLPTPAPAPTPTPTPTCARARARAPSSTSPEIPPNLSNAKTLKTGLASAVSRIWLGRVLWHSFDPWGWGPAYRWHHIGCCNHPNNWLASWIHPGHPLETQRAGTTKNWGTNRSPDQRMRLPCCPVDSKSILGAKRRYQFALHACFDEPDIGLYSPHFAWWRSRSQFR